MAINPQSRILVWIFGFYTINLLVMFLNYLWLILLILFSSNRLLKPFSNTQPTLKLCMFDTLSLSLNLLLMFYDLFIQYFHLTMILVVFFLVEFFCSTCTMNFDSTSHIQSTIMFHSRLCIVNIRFLKADHFSLFSTPSLLIFFSRSKIWI